MLVRAPYGFTFQEAGRSWENPGENVLEPRKRQTYVGCFASGPWEWRGESGGGKLKNNKS